jgi:tetratricopeptide (TPR) repeat protein
MFPHTLANIYYKSKNYSQAEKYFMGAMDINPQMLSIKHNLAVMFEDMSDTYRSDSLFKNMIVQNENDAVGLNDYAYIISERNNSSLNELDYALELAERAITIEPDNAAYLDTVGWIYYKMEIYDKAQEYLEKSLKINEDNPVILEHMGDIYLKLDASDQALLLYEKAHLKDINNKTIQDKINQINGR